MTEMVPREADMENKGKSIIRTLLALAMWLIAAISSVSAQSNGWRGVGPNVAVSSLAIDPGNPNTLYAATRSGVFKSTDAGGSWSNIGLPNATTLAIDFVNPAIIYAGTFSSGIVYSPGGQFLFKSTDGGATWNNKSSPTDFDVGLLVMDPSSSTTLYAGSAVEAAGAGGIILWRSHDGGATWTGDFTGQVGLYAWGLAINPKDPKILYAPGDLYSDGGIPQVVASGLFKSIDGGLSWSATGLTDTFLQSTAIDPVNPNIIYAGTTNWTNGHPYRGLLKSTDAGASWVEINSGLSDILSAHSAVMAIVIDSDNPDVVYAATAGSGIFKTNDAGANWRPLNDGLTNLSVQCLALAPGNSHILYAGTSNGVFRIADSVVTPTTNPVDDPRFFVDQQYRDFLNRQPDSSGESFWTSQIMACGGDPQCVQVARINDSAAFYLSIEFQQTGYLVYRTYKAAYGNLPGAPIPVKFSEFLTDTREVSQGLVVLQDGWQATLEDNKQAFLSEFVERSRFTSAFPDSITPDQFVDALNSHAGNPLSSAERDQLASDLSSQTKSRAEVLRAIAEHPNLVNAEFDHAFVLMQYFGYLRRDPNSGADSDFSGYNFWLNKLDAFNGDFTQAEMVKAFIGSGEYRQRFAQQNLSDSR